VSVYEEPAKKDLRELCSVAIDAAGFDLIDPPEPIDLPAGSDIRGKLQGDLQSVDSNGIRTVYYVRPRSGSTLPTWLGKLAMASHDIDNVEFYTVVKDFSPSFQSSCEDFGSGLLRVGEDGELERLLDYAETEPASIGAAIATRVRKLRRQMESRLELERPILEENYRSVVMITASMPTEKVDEYRAVVEAKYTALDNWGDTISTRLDSALTGATELDLQALEQDIMDGPQF
jgi:hypothetical protein